jgi:hypothetical protein
VYEAPSQRDPDPEPTSYSSDDSSDSSNDD